LAVGAVGFVWYSLNKPSEGAVAEERWRNTHGYSAQQLAANAHFNKCAQYRNTSSRVWSDQQKYYALLGEGCRSDDRDDPHYAEATYPWNEYKPWEADKIR